MLRVIAFDAAANTGYAYRDAAGKWHTGRLKIDDDAGFDAVIAAAKEAGITHAAIEDCFLSRNARTFKKLAFAEGRIWQRCRTAGLVCESIHAKTWQAAWNIHPAHGDTKVQAGQIARHLGAAAGLSWDEYDAVCMAEYAACYARQVDLPMRGRRGKGGRAAK